MHIPENALDILSQQIVAAAACDAWDLNALYDRIRTAWPYRNLPRKDFDEIIDMLVVRPGAAFGRFGQDTFERLIVNGALVGGATGIVRASSALVRGTQSGLLRVYAALMLLGITGVALYFLLQG